MRCKGAVSLLIILFISCTSADKESTSLLSLLPEKPSVVLQINDFSRFKSEVKNASLLNSTNRLKLFSQWDGFLKSSDYLTLDKTGIVGFYKSEDTIQDFILIAPKNGAFLDAEDPSQRKVETLQYQNREISSYEFDGVDFFSTLLDNYLYVSSSKALLEKVFDPNGNNPDETLQNVFKSVDTTKSANFFLDRKSDTAMLGISLGEEKDSISKRSNWISFDFDAFQNSIALNGIGIYNDSIPNFMSLFKGAKPLAYNTAKIAPTDTDAILSFTFDDYTRFNENRNAYLNKTFGNDTIFNTIEEVGIMVIGNGKAVALGSFGSETIANYLESQVADVRDYQGSELFQLSDPKLLTEHFSPLIREFDSNYYTLIENSFVFAEQQSVLEKIISDYKRGQNFSGTPLYRQGTEVLAEEANVLLVGNAEGMDYLMQSGWVEPLFDNFKTSDFKNSVFASQIVAEDHFYHHSFSISEIGESVGSKGITERFSLELDTDLATNPQFVKNHRTNQQEIVVQDKDHNLYLISSEGKVLWKKPLSSKIQGEIKQVDLYKNGKLQLAFCTNEQFMILDRNGKVVEPFGMDFEGGNLNPLAVFDYEGRKNYRFVVAQGQKVFMYNAQGKIVDGFKYTETESPIIAKPEHFRISKRDYLVFQLENGSMKIRHRAGQERIKVNKKIDFSQNGVYLYKNKFSTTDKNGVLHQVATNGRLTETNFNLNEDHGMYATSKTLALMNDNILSIKGRKVELDLGVYTPPKIFYIYDKIYVAVTDIQNQKVYLFDSQAKPIPNFPVFGSSMIDLMDMDSDRKLELVAKDRENSIIVYEMN